MKDVICRAFGDEPVKMLVVGPVYTVGKRKPQHSIPVARIADGPSINFPARDVYDFDQGRFDSLKAAYDAGDAALLKELWGAVVPVEIEAE